MTSVTRSSGKPTYVDAQRGLVDRIIFSDEAIYQQELERIFARCWNFMCHDSQIPNPGDFFMTFIGEDRVIVVRDNDMQPQVLVNSCRHRGNAVCRAEEGHATSFMCTYHGWTYDLKGALVGVPGFKEVYHEELDRENWGLIKAAKVDSYRGLIFATMDPDSPSLFDFLDAAGRQGIDGFADQGDMQCWGGVSKYSMPANWKLAHDNNWDFYHVIITHASPKMARAEYGGPPQNPNADPNPVRAIYLSEFGHCTMADSARSLFPNVFFNSFEIEMRMPKGPGVTELWRFSFYGKEWDEEKTARTRMRQNHHLGAAGFFGIEDGENWMDCTRGTESLVNRRYPFNYAMNLNRGQIVHEEGKPPRIDAKMTEHTQLWMYRCWDEYMAADSWAEYRANAPQALDVL
ncbi:MAG: aromatic ring-hydroxylating dioxygenase subunit alpha [Dehalococcoidia bacterium]